MTFIGKNTAFTAKWNCHKQRYTVFKNDNYLITLYRFNDVKNYLN